MLFLAINYSEKFWKKLILFEKFINSNKNYHYQTDKHTNE